jgi:hypothetical protein
MDQQARLRDKSRRYDAVRLVALSKNTARVVAAQFIALCFSAA